MTRINVGIPPSDLNTKHLIAEHREIKRIPNAVRTGKARIVNIPDKFKLGTGHVKFFYNKLGYLYDRYHDLYTECKKRGFKVTPYYSAWEGIDKNLLGQYTPTQQDIDIVKQRINERLNK